jgi:hypothetical protein
LKPLTHSEQLDDALVEPLLPIREIPVEERVVDVVRAQLRDQRDQLGLELVEDRTDFGRRRLRLEVVEEDVIRLVGAFGD